ncbi:MAG: polymer-forming cytoskeletal protein, partial [Betaproteobacteria bacterium]|nr:polymer-forming cytoskeletal protein [Betaproteobacteria bacterium]
QVDDLTIGSRGQVEGVVTCSSLHIKGKFTGTATCNELIVTSSASVDGHVVYQTCRFKKVPRSRASCCWSSNTKP